MPHPTTLMKLTTRCGQGAVAGLNEALLARAAGQKLLRTARVRADTTVIGADVAYPADAGLLRQGGGQAGAGGAAGAGGGRGDRDGDDRPAAGGGRARAMAATMRARAQLGRDESSRRDPAGDRGPG